MYRKLSTLFKAMPLRLPLLGAAAAAIVMGFTGCAGPMYGGYDDYSGPYYDNGYPGPYSGPYYGGYGPYDDVVVTGGYSGGHHFYGHSFGQHTFHRGGGAVFHAAARGGGFRGGGGSHGGGGGHGGHR